MKKLIYILFIIILNSCGSSKVTIKAECSPLKKNDSFIVKSERRVKTDIPLIYRNYYRLENDDNWKINIYYIWTYFNKYDVNDTLYIEKIEKIDYLIKIDKR